MSHRETVIEPAEGVTLLLGPNNCGKSAVVEALKVLSGNEGGDWFIRHHANETSIELEIVESGGEKHRIAWTKKVGTGGWYEIDDRKFERLNRHVPPELLEILKLREVEGIHPHFGDQKDSLFLINRSAPEVSKFFSSGTDISLLMRMQQELSTEKRDARKDQTRVRAERDRFVRHEKVLEPVPELEVRLQEADRAHRELESAIEKQKQVRKTVPQLLEAMDELDLLTGSSRALSGLTPPPAEHDVRGLRRIMDSMRQTAREIAIAERSQVSLNRIQSPPTPHETAELQKLVRFIPRGNRLVAKLSREVSALGSLEPAPTPVETDRLRRAIQRIRETAAEAEVLRAQTRCLARLENPPVEPDLSPLRLALTAFAQVSQQIESLRATQLQLNQEETNLRQALQEAIKNNPQCPLCGGPLSAEHLLEERHG